MQNKVCLFYNIDKYIILFCDAAMKKKSSPDKFDTRLARLQEIVLALEEGALPLEESLTLYKEGMALSKSCREQLAQAQNEILLCTEDGPRPFVPDNVQDSDQFENADNGDKEDRHG